MEQHRQRNKNKGLGAVGRVSMPNNKGLEALCVKASANHAV